MMSRGLWTLGWLWLCCEVAPRRLEAGAGVVVLVEIS